MHLTYLHLTVVKKEQGVIYEKQMKTPLSRLKKSFESFNHWNSELVFGRIFNPYLIVLRIKMASIMPRVRRIIV